jgi:hypothetical protein
VLVHHHLLAKLCMSVNLHMRDGAVASMPVGLRRFGHTHTALAMMSVCCMALGLRRLGMSAAVGMDRLLSVMVMMGLGGGGYGS